jgi:hypothetical protein
MSLSEQDHKGGRTPDVRLRSLVTILMNRYEFLLGVRAIHTVDQGLGHAVIGETRSARDRCNRRPSPRRSPRWIGKSLMSRATTPPGQLYLSVHEVAITQLAPAAAPVCNSF